MAPRHGFGAGALSIDAGAGTAQSGVVKISSSGITSGGGVTVLASRNSTLGEAVVEVSTINALGNVRVETGNGGTTTVLNNEIGSPTLIRVFAPAKEIRLCLPRSSSAANELPQPPVQDPA